MAITLNLPLNDEERAQLAGILHCDDGALDAVLAPYAAAEVRDEEIRVAFLVALELAERAARIHDNVARSAAAKIRAAGASRPVKLDTKELVALAHVIDAWEAEATTVRWLRERLPS